MSTAPSMRLLSGTQKASSKISSALSISRRTAAKLSTRPCERSAKFGSVALVADYAAITNQFLIGALMENGVTLRDTGQAHV